MLHTNHPLVTIAIPTYNRADSYLKHSLKSAVKQTYRNIEIIVSDNCSTDNTEAVVKNFDDPRIRYFKQEINIGPANNSNFCLDQANGEYFLLLQDDDLIDIEFVETCMKAADYSTDIGIIQAGTRVIDAHGKVLNECPNRDQGTSVEDYFRGWFSGKTVLYLCSTLFNRHRLKEVGGFKSKHYLFDDVIAEVHLAAKFGRIAIQDVKSSFRKHMNEETFKVNVKDWCDDSIMLLDLMCNLVPKESSTLIRKEGMRFFSRLNYSRARAVRSLFMRFKAYLTVFREFNYRYLPPGSHFLSLIHDTPFYDGLRFIKRKISPGLSHNLHD